MASVHSLTKVLTASSATKIAGSQTPGTGTINLNGAAGNYLSTTTTAAVTAGSLIIPLTSITGLVVGQVVTDSTTPTAVPTGTVIVGIDTVNSKITISQPVGGTNGIGSGDTMVFPGTAILDTQRRVIIVSGGNDSGITFTVTGTNDSGAVISEVIKGTSGATATSNLDFKTVTSVVQSGSVASTVTVGTNGVGAYPWITMNLFPMPIDISIAGYVASGVTVNYGWQYTYDDPNNLPSGVSFPNAFDHTVVNNQTVTAVGYITDPVVAIRLIVNSGTGSVRGTWTDAGV